MCIRDSNEGGLSNPPTPIFTPEPGPAGVMSLVHVGGERFRLVYAPGEILDECSLRKIDMPYMFFRPASGVRACIKAWLEQGEMCIRDSLQTDRRTTYNDNDRDWDSHRIY